MGNAPASGDDMYCLIQIDGLRIDGISVFRLRAIFSA